MKINNSVIFFLLCVFGSLEFSSGVLYNESRANVKCLSPGTRFKDSIYTPQEAKIQLNEDNNTESSRERSTHHYNMKAGGINNHIILNPFETQEEVVPKKKEKDLYFDFFQNLAAASAAHAGVMGGYPVINYTDKYNIFSAFDWSNLTNYISEKINNFFKSLDDVLDQEGSAALYADLYNYTF